MHGLKGEPTEVLYIRIKASGKKFLQSMAKREGVTITRCVEHIIDCYKDKLNASNKKKSSRAN